jgi:opacity protein-like surface antigen
MKIWKPLAAALIAVASSGGAMAADQSPTYVGVDVGARINGNDSPIYRAYTGYNVGNTAWLDLQQVHALELMVFTSHANTPKYVLSDGFVFGDERIRTKGIGLNWTTSTKLSDNWSLTSRVGINRTWSTVRYRYETGDSNYQRTAMTAGVGLAYKLTPHVSLTVDVTYMPIRITPDIEKTAPILGTGLRYDF